MGCGFEITAIGTTDSIAWLAVNKGIAEIERIERLISSWNTSSQTYQINQMAGVKAVQVDKELIDLIYRAKKVSALTNGAFDISFSPTASLWTFDKTEQQLPDTNQVKQSVAHINWQHIELNASTQTIFLKQKGMRIGFGAIGKGYAANKAKEIMQQIEGIQGGLVNASGDLLAWGKSNRPEGWRIQIANPADQKKSLGWLHLNDLAIVTSGNYEKYFTCNGKRYGHIINPSTGYPATGIQSVTIICPDAELADALSTATFVLGLEKGLALINRLNHIECLIIDDKNKVHQSNKLNLNFYE